MSRPPNASATARVVQLDGLRGVAITLVVMFHYAITTRLLWPVVWLDGIGVDLFFVMSGFLIGGIVIDHRNAANFFSVFYARRFFRIFPVYYILLAAVAIAAWLGYFSEFNRGKLIFYAIYLQNFATGSTHDYGPAWLQATWSLAVQEHFYLLLPLLVMVTSPKSLVYVLVAGIVIAFLSRILAYAIPVAYPRDFARFVTVCRMDDLFYGVLLAVAVRNQQITAAITRYRGLLYAGAAIFALGLVAVSCFNDRLGGEYLFCTVGLALLGPLYLVILALVVLHEDCWMARTAKHPVLGWLGRRSYAIFLFHMGILDFLRRTFERQGFHHFGLVLLIAALAVTLTAAALSWVLIEAPCIRYGKKHRYKYSESTAGLVLRGAV